MEKITRKCYTCKDAKDLEEFSKRKSKPLGYSYQCKKCHRIDRRRFRLKNPLQTLVVRARSRAKAANKEFNISSSDLLLTSNCPVLGIPFVFGEKMSDNSPTLDRINNSIGYVKGNVLVVSNKANRIKNSATPEEILKVGAFYKNL